jgi:hypothetical protein
MSIEMSMNVEEFTNFGRFIDVWGKRTQRIFSKNVAKQYEELGKQIAAHIHSQIAEALGGNFGEFMAARTEITVTANNNGFHLNIHGIPESKLEGADRKNAQPGNDNLWAVQEFGRYISSRRGAQKINKDVGGIAVVRKSRKGFELKGRRGAIQALVGAMMPEIESSIESFIAGIASSQIAAAGNVARRENPSKSIRGYSQFAQKLSEIGLSEQVLLSGDIGEIMTSPGTRTLLGRSASSGRFTSLGKHIKVELG